MIDSNIIGHELGHLFDSIYGGETPRDDEYLAHNPAGFQYGDDKPHPDVVRTAYGAKNMHEDKATIYEQLICGLGASLILNNHRAVREKRQLLMGRLEAALPGYLKYIFEIAAFPPSSAKINTIREHWPYNR